MTTITRGARSLFEDQTTGTSLVVPWVVNPAAGSKVFIFVISGAAPASVVDNGNLQSQFVQDGTDGSKGYIYRADGVTMPVSGEYQVTVTFATNEIATAEGVAYTGIKPGGPTATSTGSGTGTAVSSGAAVSAATGAVALGIMDTASALNPETITVTAPNVSLVNQTNGSAYICGSGVDNFPSGTSATAQWTLGDSVAWSAFVAIYDAAPAPTIADEYWTWTPPLASGSGFGPELVLQQPWLGIGTIGGSRFGVPQLRGQDYEIPFASGQTWRAKWANSRTITLVMWLAGIDQADATPGTGPNNSQILAWNENWATIRKAFYARGPNGSLQGLLGRRWLLNQGPVLVQSFYTPKVGGGSAVCPTFEVQAGDVIVLKGISRDQSDSIGSVFGGSLSWGSQGSISVASRCWTGMWTATVPATLDGTTITVSATCAGDFATVVEQWRNCSLVAATNSAQSANGAAGIPSLAVTGATPGSYITWCNGDWNNGTATPAYLSQATEAVRDRSSSHFAGYYANQPAETTETVGMTAPTGQNWSTLALVLLPTPTIVEAAAMAEVAGTMDPTMTGRTRADFSTDLLLSDPYFYGDPQAQSLYLGVVNQMVNLGEAAVAEGKFQANNAWTCVLNGPLTSPITITNSTLGITFELAATIGSGHLVTVDFLNCTAVDDLSNNLVGDVTHAGSRQWMMLAPGVNNVELTSGSGSDTGYAALSWSPGYV